MPYPPHLVRRQDNGQDEDSSQPTMNFVFPSLGDAQTCGSLFIQWFYNGPTDNNDAIALYVTNEGLQNSSPPSTTDDGSTTANTQTTDPGTDTATPTNTAPTDTTSNVLSSVNPGGPINTESGILSNPAGTGTETLPTDPATSGEDSFTIETSTGLGTFSIPEGTGIGTGINTNPVITGGGGPIITGRAVPTGASNPSPVPQPAVTSSEPGSITIQIGNTLFAPASGNYTWDKVTVPAGMYVVEGVFPNSQYDYGQRSLPFFVSNGSDTSCLNSIPTTILPTGPNATGQPSTTAIAGLSSGSHTNKGAIAGGVLGGLAVIAALIGVLLFHRYKQRKARTGAVSRWNRLGDIGAGFRDRKPRPRDNNNFDYPADVKTGRYVFSGPQNAVGNDAPAATARDVPAPATAAVAPVFFRAPPSGGHSPTQAAQDPFSDSYAAPGPATESRDSPNEFDSPILFTPESLGYQYQSSSQHPYANHGNSANGVGALGTINESTTSIQKTPDAAYPSGASGALPRDADDDDDTSAVWASNDPNGQGDYFFGPGMQRSTSSSSQGPSSHRKPVPAYSPGPSTIASVGSSTPEPPERAEEPESAGMAGVGSAIRRGFDPKAVGRPSSVVGVSEMGKPMRYLVPDIVEERR